MNFIKNNLANILTLGNLFSGTIGVIHLIHGDYQTTAICLIVSMVLDFFDGFVARALKANSNLGVQLDSLADMVSFGVIPGLTMYQFLLPFGHELLGIALPFKVAYIGILITAFSCLRLAIFNIDDEQTYYFKGLNTPSNTILIFGVFYAYQTFQPILGFLNQEWVLLAITLISSWLLVSPIKMISLKFKSMKLQDNYPKVALLVGVIILFALLNPILAIPLTIIYYMLISIIFQNQLK